MKLTVDGMTCGHCERSVTNAILALDLGARVNIDLASKLVRIEGRLAVEDAIKAIADAGYQAALAEIERPLAGQDPVAASACCGSCHA